jgi:hypothetical protein
MVIPFLAVVVGQIVDGEPGQHIGHRALFLDPTLLISAGGHVDAGPPVTTRCRAMLDASGA